MPYIFKTGAKYNIKYLTKGSMFFFRKASDPPIRIKSKIKYKKTNPGAELNVFFSNPCASCRILVLVFFIYIYLSIDKYETHILIPAERG